MCMWRNMSWNIRIISSTLSAVWSDMSTPAEKALPSALITRALRVASPSMVTRASFISSIIAMSSTFRGALARTMVATPPSRSSLMSLYSPAMLIPLRQLL